MKPVTKFQYGKELAEEHGIDYAIKIFEDRVKVKEEKMNSDKTFAAKCEWSGDKVVLDYLNKQKQDGKID